MSTRSFSWVKKLAVSTLAVAMLAVPIVQAASFGYAPDILTSSASPNPFNPDNGPLAITYTLGGDPGNIEIDILNSSFVKVRDLVGLTPSYNVSQPVYWDGTINGADAPAGYYYYYITASNGNGSDTASGLFELTYNSTPTPGNPPVVGSSSGNDSSDYASPNPFDPNTQTTTIYYTMSGADAVSVKIYDGATLIETLSGPTMTQAVWDGKNSSNVPFAEKTYTYKITATNNYGSNTEEGPVTIQYASQQGNPPVVGSSSGNDSSDYASPNPFDPNTQTTTIYYTMSGADAVSVKIYDGATLIETLSGATMTQAVWDGKNSSNVPFAEKTYTYKITATNNYGSNTEEGTVTIEYAAQQGNPPVVGSGTGNDSSDYASPNPFDPNVESTNIYYTITGADSVSVKIYDGSSLVETLSGATMTKAVWDGKDSSNDPYAEKTYTYKITATNNFGSNTEEGTVTIEYENNGTTDGPDITTHYADPSTFNPEEENTQIFYRMDETADVTVEIWDGGTRIRTLVDDVTKTGSTTHNVTWNGDDRFGDQVADGSYTYKITACDTVDTNLCDTASGAVRVDTDGGSNGTDDLISNVEVNNAVFDPTENEKAEICFDIENDNTEITVQVLDGSKVIRTLADNVELDQITKCYKWDGKDKDGDIVDDDVYQFRVKAEHGNDTEVELAYTEVDTDGIIIGFPNGSNFCAGFTDIPKNSPFCKAIELMYFRGIFTGYPDGTFRPYADINRAEATKVILLALDYNILSDDGTNLGFWDVVKRAWYMPYLRTGRQNGIIHGYPDGSFRPGNTMNRVELLKVFLESTDIDIPYCNVQPYADTPINYETRWYMDYACFAKAYGLMGTDAAGNFHPDQPMTRADVANLFYQFEIRGLFDGYNPMYYNNYYNNFTGFNPYGYSGYSYTTTPVSTSYFYY